MIQDLVISIVFITYAISVLMGFGTILTWVERKQAAVMSDRIGANRAYVRIPFTQVKLIWLGLFHGMADGLKLLLKEDFKPITYDRLAYALVFRALKDRLGLLRIRSASTGGAALGPDVFKFFNAMGVNLKQIYGQTEISGISCIHREGDINFDSVGKPIPETEIRLSDTGEILSRSPSVFLGYYKNPEETEKTLNGGWLHSGDAGYFTDDGHLVVIDRVKDVMHLNDGTRFSPQFIENKLKFSPYIKECVCLGNDRDFIASMLCIDYPNVGKWAESRRLSYTTYTDLAAKPEVLELLAKEVETVNATLPAATRVKKFVPLYKELDADDDELTRTRKVRRAFVGERYQHVIEGMYAGENAIPIDATIKYQDGKTSRIKTLLTVRNL